MSSDRTSIQKPVQWMMPAELHDELDQTRPAGETTDPHGVLANGQLPALSQDAHRHQLVAEELLQRPS